MKTRVKRPSKRRRAGATRSKALRGPTVASLRRSPRYRDEPPPVAVEPALRADGAVAPKTVEVVSGQERLVFLAEKEIVFRCGAASITLMADGTVLIKGSRLVSSSSGLTRIRGAAVKIN